MGGAVVRAGVRAGVRASTRRGRSPRPGGGARFHATVERARPHASTTASGEPARPLPGVHDSGRIVGVRSLPVGVGHRAVFAGIAAANRAREAQSAVVHGLLRVVHADDVQAEEPLKLAALDPKEVTGRWIDVVGDVVERAL